MDLKSNGGLVKSDTDRHKIICPNCNTLNEMDSLFCFSCGTKLKEARSAKVNLDEFEEGKASHKFPTDVQTRDKIQVEDMELSLLSAGEAMKQNMPFMENKNALQQSQPVPKEMTFHTDVKNSVEDVEEISVFAQGLPNWDMVPPQVVVRRKAK